MRNRDRHEITMEILKMAISGKKKTEIIRGARLSYMQSNQYLDLLVKKGLLEIDEKYIFRTTEKGREFLEKCRECPLFKWDRLKERKFSR